MLELAITVPNYIRQVRLSNSRRAVYYEWDGQDIRARKSKLSKGKELPKKYISWGKHLPLIAPNQIKGLLGVKVDNKFRGFITPKDFASNGLENLVLLKHYCMSQFNLTINQSKKVKFVVCNDDKEPILSNPKVAGTPRMYTINGQDFYSGNLREHTRAKVVSEIKRSFVSYVKGVPKIKTPEFPNSFAAVLEIHDTIKNEFDRSKDELGTGWDVGNRGHLPYLKTMLDLLCTGKISKTERAFAPILEDDHRLIISKESIEFFPIKPGQQRKLIFKLVNRDISYVQS